MRGAAGLPKRRQSQAKARWIATSAALLAAALPILASAQTSGTALLGGEPSVPARVIGKTNAGCVVGAEPLALDGPGWEVMRPSRNRFYGHPELIAFIQWLGAAAEQQGHTLLVGDMAQPHGGPMPNGHRSHQSGIDVDIWFMPAPGRDLTLDQRETISARSMVTEGGGSVDPAVWTPWESTLLYWAASYPEVERIFVNPAIKRELCATTTGDRTWLQRIRPWWGHDDHLHVRLVCPPGSDSCVSGPPLPPGDGCDASLDWWFSDEAREQLRTARLQPHKPQTLADLPAECQAILAGSETPLAGTASADQMR